MVGDTGGGCFILWSWKGRLGLVVLFRVEPGTIWRTRTLSEGGMIVASLFLMGGHKSLP